MNALNQVDVVPRASVVASRRAHEHFVTTSSGSQTYSRITASGSSRIHNGNNYFITYDCSTGHSSLPMLPSDQQTTVECVSRSSQKRKRSVSDAPESTRGNRERQTLATVLESLGQYSKSMPQQSEGEQSGKIAAQLAVILESFEQGLFDGEAAAGFEAQLRDLKDQLRRARRVKINAVSPRAQASRQCKAQSKLTRIAWGQWEISLYTKVLHSRSIDGQMLTETCSALDVQNTFGSRGPCIAAYFVESVVPDRTITIHPVVLAYNQVNRGARVLELVKNDDLDGLMRHLALGQASIRDCDEEGRSLLHYACHYASEATCKFLVDSGCDVDRTSLAFLYRESRNTPLSEYNHSIPSTVENSFERSMMCRKHLLQAGADPTLGLCHTKYDSWTNPALMHALEEKYDKRRTTEPFEQTLREGSAFFDVRSFRDQGQSIWMHACSTVSELSSPEILYVLVEAGAMVAEVDDDGWNCLFKCVGHASCSWASNEFEALRYLLTMFEDIYARDWQGRTIFDVVADSTSSPIESLGSYRQDLWYCALFRSGLAQRFNIPLRPGRLTFIDGYREKDYRAMLYLDTWGPYVEEQPIPDYSLADKDALSEQDREAAPGLREWNPPDLVMMEERIGQADYHHRYDRIFPAHSAMADSFSEESDEWVSEDEEQEEEEDLLF